MGIVFESIGTEISEVLNVKQTNKQKSVKILSYCTQQALLANVCLGLVSVVL